MDSKSVKVRFQINSPRCGRDKRGRFKCVCGKCKAILSERNDNGDNSGNGGNS